MYILVITSGTFCSVGVGGRANTCHNQVASRYRAKDTFSTFQTFKNAMYRAQQQEDSNRPRLGQPRLADRSAMHGAGLASISNGATHRATTEKAPPAPPAAAVYSRTLLKLILLIMLASIKTGRGATRGLSPAQWLTPAGRNDGRCGRTILGAEMQA